MKKQKKAPTEAKATDGKQLSIAKIGLLSAVIVSLIGVLGNILPKLIEVQTTRTTETQLASQNVTLPVTSVTSTQAPVPTPFFQDDFRSNINNWEEDSFQGEYATIKYEIVNGKYRKSFDFYTPFHNYTPWVPGVSRKNFDLTFEASIVQASNLDNIAAIIIIAFRASLDNRNAYIVLFSNSGWRVIVKENGNCCYPIFNWRQSDAFQLDIGKVNIFGVSAKDSHYTISANSKELISFDDNTLDEAGEIGIGAGTESSTQQMIVEFDNLTIRDINE